MKTQFHEYGVSNGKPLLFFHGFPASGKQAGLLNDVGLKHGFKVIGFDRPGYGGSVWSGVYSDDELIRFFSSIESYLADQLRKNGHDKIYVIGVSGGAPYATRFAAFTKLPVEKVSLVCGLGPLAQSEVRESYPAYTQKFLKIYQNTPDFVWRTTVRGFQKMIMNNTDRVLTRLNRILHLRDQNIMTNDRARKSIFESLRHAHSQGPHGVLFDLNFYLSPWKLKQHDFKDIKFDIWHGTADKVVPYASASFYNKQIPKSRLFEVKGEAHYSLPVLYQDKILAEMLN